jgi:DNA-binding response OmpR family regulator
MQSRILIIDDDEVMLATTEALLQAAGYAVSTHLGAFGATSAITTFLPDLVLVDVNMPGLSGTGFAALVRGMARFDGIRIYFLSSQDEEGLRASVEESGADGYILKGDRAELLRRVAAVLAAPAARRDGGGN